MGLDRMGQTSSSRLEKEMKKHKHGGAQLESKMIEKYADQWCKDNGYPIQKRVRTRYPKKIKSQI
jgi:hypothetical protein|tara:strand:+ start:1162 stop:1356 length:195 start_codon:yes stop_codon:yes gene_type:complete